MTVAVYAGSFDPVTYGHLSVGLQASKAFSNLIIAVGYNSSKTGTFTPDERMTFIRDATQDWGNVRVVSFEGLLMDYCVGLLERNKHVVIVRGLRALSDLESEMAIADANRRINPDIPTVFLPALPSEAFISSSMARELARYPGSYAALGGYVPGLVQEALRARIAPSTVPPTPEEEAPESEETEASEEPE